MKYEESDRIELKSIINDDLKKEIVAFLNTHGGTIYVGVNDDGSLNPKHKKKELGKKPNSFITIFNRN